ncbi:MAG TPA: bacterial transcriptional activator domain-containing protein, partial [Anaerolineaceae bacterium]|nr:bacterial transcriptional activator domain-containing protein [Anaerolineaceae bacterium]
TRERLRQTGFAAAERLVQQLIHDRQYESAIPVCQAILAHDRAWEPAYRQLMQIYSAVGNRPQVVNSYNRCVAALREELDVEPSEETEALLNRLTS